MVTNILNRNNTLKGGGSNKLDVFSPNQLQNMAHCITKPHFLNASLPWKPKYKREEQMGLSLSRMVMFEIMNSNSLLLAAGSSLPRSFHHGCICSYCCRLLEEICSCSSLEDISVNTALAIIGIQYFGLCLSLL